MFDFYDDSARAIGERALAECDELVYSESADAWLDRDCAVYINDEWHPDDSDDIAQCDRSRCSEWHLTDDGITTECGERYCSETCAENEGFYYIDCEWRNADEWYSCDECGEWFHNDSYESYFTEDGCYCCHACAPSEPDGLIGDYHDTCRSVASADECDPYRIGFEIEKECGEYRERLTDCSIELPSGWLAESDGSLCGDTGFEIVTRAYNLRETDRLLSDLESARGLLDCECTGACGGHITVSKHGLTAAQFADRIAPAFPALMALYSGRLRNGYSKPAKKSKIRPDGERGAFAIRAHGRVELRIFPRVHSHRCLVRRFDLVRWILETDRTGSLNSETVCAAMARNGAIGEIFAPVYSAEQWQARFGLYSSFAQWFEIDECEPAQNISRFVSDSI